MPTPSTGTVLEINGVRYARVTLGKGELHRFSYVNDRLRTVAE